MIQSSHGRHAQEKKYGAKKWMFYFTVIISAIIVYKLLDNFAGIQSWISNLFGILTPFIVGIMISYILYLPCRRIEQAYKTTKSNNFFNKHARGLSITTVYIMTIIVIFIIFSFVIPILMESLGELISNIPNYYNIINEKINLLPEDNLLRSEVVKNVINEINKIDYKSLLDINRLTQYVKGAISVVRGMLDILVSVVVSIYILSQRRKIINDLSRFNKALFSKKMYLKVEKYFRNGNEIFFKFLTSQILDALIVGIILTIAMIILKVKYAVLLGFMIGLFNMIPFFGAIVAVIMAVIITALTGGWVQAGVTAIVIIILQQIDANIINPKIIGDSLNISQLLVIFAVTVGGAYYGIWGMFLAVPIVTVMKMVI